MYTATRILFAAGAAFLSSEFALAQLPHDTALPSLRIEGRQWCRHTFRLPVVSDDSVTLSLATTGTATVYLNGQRLVRNHAFDERSVSWTIGKLLRPGVNSVAIAISGTSKDNQLVGLFSASTELRADNMRWKVTSSPPPVGWQQTDFNDRDWQAPKAAPAKPIADGRPSVRLAWELSSGKGRSDRGRFRFRDGDHVVLLGGTFIERAQEFGHLEAALNAYSPDLKLTFRNLGWSADTVFAESRGIFDSPQKGYERMVEHVRAEEPNVILVCYGQNEAMSFARGVDGLDRFGRQLAALHRDLATTGAEIVYLSPHPFLPVDAPLPDPTPWNPVLKQVADVVRNFASDNDAVFVDLYTDLIADIQTCHAGNEASHPMPGDLQEHPELVPARNHVWTDNGIHWNDAGYRCVSTALASRLFEGAAQLSGIQVDLAKQTTATAAGDVRNVTWKAGGVSFEYRPAIVSGSAVAIRISGIPQSAAVAVAASVENGNSTPLARKPGDNEAGFISFVAAPDDNSPYEQLRRLTVRKNELYFHRWRPQNITYLYGFRKHEQGNNASEIALFDPLIVELEQQIHTAKQPVWQSIAVTLD